MEATSCDISREAASAQPVTLGEHGAGTVVAVGAGVDQVLLRV